MEEDVNIIYNNLVNTYAIAKKPQRMESTGRIKGCRPRHVLRTKMDNMYVKSDIVRMQLTNWKNCTKDQTKWKTFVEVAKTSLKL
jgi:hypothetical protein